MVKINGSMLNRPRILFPICFLLLIIISNFSPGIAKGEDWPMFLKTPQHISIGTGAIPDEVEIIWEVDISSYGYSSPVIVDGKVYVGSGYLEDDEKYDSLGKFKKYLEREVKQ